VPFANGLATNVGGDKPGVPLKSDGWHIAKAKGLPSRFITVGGHGATAEDDMLFWPAEAMSDQSVKGLKFIELYEPAVSVVDA